MYKLGATILKDIRILIRDKVGLIFMFGLPILLVVVITTIQNSTFDLVNKNKLPFLICNKDTGKLGVELIQAIDNIGMFKRIPVPGDQSEEMIIDRVRKKEAMLAIIIPVGFSSQITAQSNRVAGKALNSFG